MWGRKGLTIGDDATIVSMIDAVRFYSVEGVVHELLEPATSVALC